jgi:hypothetical protein
MAPLKRRMFIEMQGGVQESNTESAISMAEIIDCFLPSLSGLVTCGRPEPSIETLGYSRLSGGTQNGSVPARLGLTRRRCLGSALAARVAWETGTISSPAKE